MVSLDVKRQIPRGRQWLTNHDIEPSISRVARQAAGIVSVVDDRAATVNRTRLCLTAIDNGLRFRRSLGTATFHQAAKNIAGRVAGVFALRFGGTGLLGLFFLRFLGGIKGVRRIEEFFGNLVGRLRFTFGERLVVVSSSSSSNGSSTSSSRFVVRLAFVFVVGDGRGLCRGDGGCAGLGGAALASLNAAIVIVSPP